MYERKSEQLDEKHSKFRVDFPDEQILPIISTIESHSVTLRHYEGEFHLKNYYQIWINCTPSSSIFKETYLSTSQFLHTNYWIHWGKCSRCLRFHTLLTVFHSPTNSSSSSVLTIRANSWKGKVHEPPIEALDRTIKGFILPFIIKSLIWCYNVEATAPVWDKNEFAKKFRQQVCYSNVSVGPKALSQK